MNKLLIPGFAAIAILCSPAVYGQAVVRETTTTTAAPDPAEPLETVGTVSEFGPDRVIIRREGVAEPVPYGFARHVEYVDETGAPVERTVIRRDMPVTVRYVREGDRMLVNRVIVHRTVAPAATTVVPAETTTVVPATEATRTTTTTSTTVSGHDAKEIDKRREKIAKLEREIAEHPDRERLREDLADEKAKLERLERDIQERR